jgi:hypothetical protein
MPDPIVHPRVQILQSLDGVLSQRDSERVQEHLSGCPDCRDYLSLVRDFGSGIKELLEDPFTAAEPCPDTELLVAYEAGELPENEARQVSDHVLFCDKCTDGFYALRRLRGSSLVVDVEMFETEGERGLRRRGQLRPWYEEKEGGGISAGSGFTDRVVVDGETTSVGLMILAGRRTWAPGASVQIELDPPQPSWDAWMEPGSGCERIHCLGLKQSKVNVAGNLGAGTYLLTIRRQAEVVLSYRLNIREAPAEHTNRPKEPSQDEVRSLPLTVTSNPKK